LNGLAEDDSVILGEIIVFDEALLFDGLIPCIWHEGHKAGQFNGYRNFSLMLIAELVPF